MKDEIVQIESQDFWIKIVGMLQQNWAVIETNNEHVQVYFMSDRSGVFDVMEFDCIIKCYRAFLILTSLLDELSQSLSLVQMPVAAPFIRMCISLI